MNLLITGGTGSLGNALTSNLLSNKFRGKIIIFSRDEMKQADMAAKFSRDKSRLRFLIGDVRDKDRLALAIRDATHIVHAAALKIVDSAEYNPLEYIKTNIYGSQNLIECCIESGKPRKVLAISTDKAVMPVNAYGATKLAMEKLMLASNNIMGKKGPRFSVCRYGNVALSRGSVIPLFARQASQRKKITLTDTRMTRFHISLEAAAEYVKNRIFNMKGGEIFIPNMPAYNLLDLAECFGSEIVVTGARPGEKLHEDIATFNETEIGVTKQSNSLNALRLSKSELTAELKRLRVL